MTIAMCLSCGGEKWGAFTDCNACGVGIVESTDLMIAFSDHHLSVEELTGFGAGLATLRAAQVAPETDDALWVRVFAFLEWVTAHRSDVLSATAPPALRDAVDELSRSVTMPPAPARSEEHS